MLDLKYFEVFDMVFLFVREFVIPATGEQLDYFMMRAQTMFSEVER